MAALLCTGLAHAQSDSNQQQPAKSGKIPVEAVPADSKPVEDELVVLSPFEVSSQKDTGYQATETLAGTRIRTNLKDVGSAISVYTRDFMRDIGANDNSTLLQFTVNAEVAGTRGTYAGLGNAQTVNETGTLRAPAGAQRVRGLAAADNTRDFFVTDIPWDSFNVDRVDIQRGPNSLLFGLGSPAGIINASTRNAEYRNSGSAEVQVGSYGSVRKSLDINRELIPGVLAIRVDGLLNNQKFQQKEAWQDDVRYSGALRFDPKLFESDKFHTSIKVKFENGDIKANRPRTVSPQDAISPWFAEAGKIAVGTATALLPNQVDTYALGASVNGTSPWLNALVGQQTPGFLINGTTGQTYQINAGYINNGFRNNDGSLRGPGDNAIGMRYSEVLYGLRNYQDYAYNAQLPYYNVGQYKAKSLRNSSLFDFYNHLIDGNNKSEWEKWQAYNVTLSQTGWNDRVGIELNFDKQIYNRGGQGLLDNPTLSIDVMKNFQDGTTNPNFGRPFVQAAASGGGGNSYKSERTNKRASLFGELRASDFTKNEFLVKLLGKQRFNIVGSTERYFTETRSWNQYANDNAWDAYWNRSTGYSNGFQNRSPVAIIYLGSSLANAATGSYAGVPSINSNITLNSGYVYAFDSTWIAPASVNFGDAWTVPTTGNVSRMINAGTPPVAMTQASNPANYKGWNTGTYLNVINNKDGQNPSLQTGAQMVEKLVKSYAGSWQAFMWKESIVPTLGWRYDEVKTKSATAGAVSSNKGMLNLEPNSPLPNPYRLPDTYLPTDILKEHSVSGGLVFHVNKALPKGWDAALPVNVSLTYNDSSNFQATSARKDVYGATIDSPTGKTKEFGVLLATKNNKFSLRVMRYETNLQNAFVSNENGFNGAIVQGLKFRNVFLYKLTGYTWDTRRAYGDAGPTFNNRNYWTQAYLDNTTGRPVQTVNLFNYAGATVPANSTLETAAQASAHRDSSIRAWNDIQKWLEGKGYFAAWGFTPTTTSALTDRATYEASLDPATNLPTNPAYMPDTNTLSAYGSSAPSGYTITSDSESKGYEFELTANPTNNWRISFNASQTTASRTNVGGKKLDELISYLDTQMAGVAGDMRQFNGDYQIGNELRANYNGFRARYTLLKLQENTAASELRKWRYNIVSNYTFSSGFMKDVNVGGSYRWQDKIVLGYPVASSANGIAQYDLSKPYYGPVEEAGDVWIGYERKITKDVKWRIQLNVRNVMKENGMIPLTVEPDGQTWASARVKPVQEWTLTNTFLF